MRGTTTLTSPLKRLAVMAAASVAITTLGSFGSPASAHKPPTVQARRHHIADRALGQIGSPYSYASESPRSGFDCSGLTYWTFKNHGDTLPRRSIDQWRLRFKPPYKRIFRKSNLRRGDLVFFKTSSAAVGHVGIYLANGKFVSTTRRGVKRDSIRDRYYWKPRYVGAVRVPALRAPTTTSDGDDGDN